MIVKTIPGSVVCDTCSELSQAPMESVCDSGVILITIPCREAPCAPHLAEDENKKNEKKKIDAQKKRQAIDRPIF